jgi:hypothetical protein
LGIEPIDIFPETSPHRPSRTSLPWIRALRRLTTHSTDLSSIQSGLLRHIQTRLQTPGLMKTLEVTPSDINNLEREFKSKTNTLPILGSTSRSSKRKSATPQSSTPSQQPPHQSSSSLNPTPPIPSPPPPSIPSPIIPEGSDRQSDGEPMDIVDPSDREDADSSEDTSSFNPSCKKGCPSAFLNLLLEFFSTKRKNEIMRFDYFLRGLSYDPESFCRDHLRTWLGKTIHLSTQLKTKELLLRLEQIPTSFIDLQAFRNDPEYSFYFHKSVRTLTDTQLLEPFLYHPLPEPSFIFNPRQVITRIAGSEAFDTWLQDGNLIIPGFLNHLNDRRVAYRMTLEFDLYKHHFQNHLTRKSMGFRRNMFYSLSQQLIRQDPAWYALNASCRPTPHWRLITYPYITKDADVDEPLGFLHMDVNFKDFFERQIGANQLTSSVSLDTETVDGCTVLVPGFHHHAYAWYELLKTRGVLEEMKGSTTPAQQLYTPTDILTFGRPEPFPCNAGDVRITRGEIIHGSTKGVFSRRRVLFPWHTAIQEDHQTLEIPGQHTWQELSMYHTIMLPPTQGVGGNTAIHSRPKTRFPPAVHMPSSSALCDALIGRRPWTDPQVLEERDIVLGTDDELALKYIRKTRVRLMENFLHSSYILEQNERRMYGENSFFATLPEEDRSEE